MDKRAFIKSVREWDFAAVKKALAKEPELASYEDKLGKRPLHHCAGINGREEGLAAADSVKTARTLVAAGADVNAVRIIMDEGEEFRATPLWYAVAWGKNFELSRFLLESGANPNDCLWAAAWDQNKEMVKLLHSFGAELDPVFHDETPLLQIVKAKRFALLKWLVDHGANINFQNSEGNTALHFAIKRNYTLSEIQDLLSCGASPTIKAKDGTTALSLASKLNKTKAVKLLEQYAG
jgi:ankyrin repeat protein